MRNIFTIAGREIRSYFVSPIAYVVLTGFLLLGGWFFFNLLARFKRAKTPAQRRQSIRFFLAWQVSASLIRTRPRSHSVPKRARSHSSESRATRSQGGTFHAASPIRRTESLSPSFKAKRRAR